MKYKIYMIIRTILLFVILAYTGDTLAESVVSPWDQGQVELGANAPTVIPGSAPILYSGTFTREREMYNYNPRFLAGLVTFDKFNRPYIFVGVHGVLGSSATSYPSRAWVSDSYIQTLNSNGVWRTYSVKNIIKSVIPTWDSTIHSGIFIPDERVVFDKDGDAYFTVIVNGISGTLLFHSNDGLQSWKYYNIGSGNFRLELTDTFNDCDAPPVLVTDAGSGVFLIAPRKNSDGTLTIPARITIAAGANYQLSPVHSGLANATVTIGSKVHIVYLDTAASSTSPGSTDQYYITYDKTTGLVSIPQLLGSTLSGYGVADEHNGPGITIDSQGALHVMLGSHQKPFKYVQSSDGGQSWTTPVDVQNTQTESETYVSLVTDKNNTKHLVTRMKNSAGKLCLHYMRKKTSDSAWVDKGLLVVPYRIPYSNYYQRLTIDKLDRLFIAYYYYAQDLTEAEKTLYRTKWPTDPDPDVELRAHDPVIMMSDNGGDSWRLAKTSDFLSGITSAAGQLKLVAFYSHNDAGRLNKDNSGNNANLQNNTGVAPTAVAGRVNDAAYFNGSTSGYDIKLAETNPAIYPTGSFTVCAWVNPAAVTANMCVTRPSSIDGGFAVFTSGTTPTWRGMLYNLNSNNEINSGVNIVGGEWCHVAVTFDAATVPDVNGTCNGITKIYINGVQKNTATLKYRSGGFRFGLGQRGDGTARFNGSIDEFAVFQNALTAEQIAALANGDETPLTLANPMLGDINNDDQVNVLDIFEMSSNWLYTK